MNRARPGSVLSGGHGDLFTLARACAGARGVARASGIG